MDVDEDEDGTQQVKKVPDYGIEVDFEGLDDEEEVALLEGDAFLLHPIRQPVMSVEPDADVAGEVGADAHEHATAVRIVQIEVVQIDRPPFDSNVVGLDQVPGDAFVFACFEDDRNPVP